ncbi:MAG TPA: arginine--tRNA ligase [Thermoleophilia bacterium]|nr:arginine--tRNA ligase [Thermoleophilia bacterium]
MSERSEHEELYGLTGLGRSLERTLATIMPTGEPLPAVELTLPPKPEFGDVSTPVALAAARLARRNPRDLATELGERWSAGPGAGICERFEVAGPGFLNLFLSDEWYLRATRRMLALGDDHGRDVLPAGSRLKVNIEFVSVNPTGPLHVGHARYASMGDALCRLFAFAGHDVTREFYVNDFGSQMAKFGQSLTARYAQRLGIEMPVPDDGYLGEYLLEVADRLIADVGERYREAVAAAAPEVGRVPAAVVDEIKLWGRDEILGRFRHTLGRLRVPFDVWTSEASLYDGGTAHRGFGGEVGKALRELDADGELFDADGAVWLRTTDYGDDKDRVLIRQTGAPTYFLSDIAYHRDKMDRGFEHLIDIWGADHHGYVPRMKASFTALPPHDPDRLELIIGQLVNLLESGEARRMSKRRGDIVTVDDLVEAIGVDAVRFFMVGRSHDSTLDLDLDLAVEQSSKNPVYYVQYAHARICSVLRNLAAADGPGGDSSDEDATSGEVATPGAAALAPPAFDEIAVGPYERDLVRTLARFPLVVLEAVERRGPHRVHAYLGELAAEFHVFYRNCRVLTDDPEVAGFRTGLCIAARTTLAKGLELLGVSAPQSM